MKIYQTKDIRNIALVGGAKSGKTTIAEAMLFLGGTIKDAVVLKIKILCLTTEKLK